MTSNPPDDEADIPFFDIDLLVVDALNAPPDEHPNRKPKPDYARLAQALNLEAERAIAAGERVSFHPEIIQALAHHLTDDGRKRQRGPQTDIAMKRLLRGRHAHDMIEQKIAKKSSEDTVILIEYEVADKLGLSHSELRRSVAFYRKFKDFKLN